MKNINYLALIVGICVSSTAIAAEEQVCDPMISRVAPDSRFKDLGNGEVEDLKTGLVWQHCSIGQTWDGSTCTGEAENLTWLQALKKTKALGNGYRLPNFKEAASLVERACKPAINISAFPNLPSRHYHWTSTAHPLDNTQVLLFNISGGDGVNQQFMAMTKESAFGGYKKTLALPVRNK